MPDPTVDALRARVAELEAAQCGHVRDAAALTRETGLLRTRTADLHRHVEDLLPWLEAEVRRQAARADAAEAQVVRVREALEILTRNATGTPASSEEANRCEGIREAVRDVEGALELASRPVDPLQDRPQAASGVASSARPFKLAFVAIGASGTGITHRMDDLLADGFGRADV